MEFLSLIATRTDSGAGVRQNPRPDSAGGSQFDKLLGKALKESEGSVKSGKNPGAATYRKDAEPIVPKEPLLPDDDTDDTDPSTVAGMMGDQSKVVFILEGDKESAITPEMRISDATLVIGTPWQDPAMGEADTLNLADAEMESDVKSQTTELTEMQTPKAEASDQSQTARAATATEAAMERAIAQELAARAKAEPSTAGAEIEQDAGGEVAARTPIRMVDKQGEGQNEDSSEKGDPSPLENENGAAPAKGRKDKTYSETEESVRNAADGSARPTHNAGAAVDGLKPERFQADQQLRSMPTGMPVRQENRVEEMVSRIETMQNETKQSMTIQLKPEFLGKVALEVAVDAAGLHVKISAANSDVRAMVSGQINTLIQSLEHKGIQVVEVEVAYTGVDNGAFTDPRENGARPDGSRQSRHAARVDDSASYFAALSVDALGYFLDAGISTVEYRA
jgi:flagellar hook-length control protein FliK